MGLKLLNVAVVLESEERGIWEEVTVISTFGLCLGPTVLFTTPPSRNQGG